MPKGLYLGLLLTERRTIYWIEDLRYNVEPFTGSLLEVLARVRDLDAACAATPKEPNPPMTCQESKYEDSLEHVNGPQCGGGNRGIRASTRVHRSEWPHRPPAERSRQGVPRHPCP